MATTSTILGLKLNEESDPFLLSDFIGNWGILDASPGVFICTSTSLPSWGSAQAGRLVFQTDLHQLSRWNGSTFKDLVDSAPVFAGGSLINASQAAGASANYNILTFTTPRPSSLAIVMTGSYACGYNLSQDLLQSVVFDGVEQQMGSFREGIRFEGDPGFSSGSYSGDGAVANATTLAVIPAVTAGQHQIGLKVTVQNTYTASVKVKGAKVIAFIALYSSGNSL